MKPLEEWLSEQRERTIETLASYIEQSIREQWQEVLEQHLEELVRLYDKAGEAAYGRYAGRLFRPLHTQLTQAGFSSSPSFPGTLSTSREWGSLEARECWMWSVVREATGVPVGVLVVRLVHDHTQFRLPSAPSVFAIKAECISGPLSANQTGQCQGDQDDKSGGGIDPERLNL